MKKCLKIIPVWLGVKRLDNANISTGEQIEDIITNEIEIENGMPVDVCLTIQDTADEEINNSLDKFNNTKTKNGKIFIRKRENTGLSFGGYLWTYIQYRDDYDYFLFTEDDVVIFRDNIIKKFADYLDENEDCSFLSLLPIVTNEEVRASYKTSVWIDESEYMPNMQRISDFTHAGGGIGMTSKTNMELSYRLPQRTLDTWAYENTYYGEHTYLPSEWEYIVLPTHMIEEEKKIQKESTDKEEYFKKFNKMMDNLPQEEHILAAKRILWMEDVKQLSRGEHKPYRMNHEIEFTATMHRPDENKTIQNHPDFSNLALNWELHSSAVDRLYKGHPCINLDELEKECIYILPKKDDLKIINEFIRPVLRKKEGTL